MVTGCSPTTNSGPSYNGRTLSEWLVEYEAAGGTNGIRETNAIIAIRAIGSDAVPFLVKWINVDYTPPERVVDFMVWGYEPPRIKKGNRAMRAFQILGTNAAQAIPGLTNIILQDKRYGAAIDARYGLIYIGPPGVTALGMLATNRTTPHRFETVDILRASIRTEAGEVAKPVFTNCLSDPNPNVRFVAKEALADIAEEDARKAKAK